MSEQETKNGEKKRTAVTIREMIIDDLAPVFHLGEKLFTAEKSLNLYRTWDEYEVMTAFQNESTLCLVAELETDEKLVGFLLGTTIEKRRSSWKYGYLVWLGVDPEYSKNAVATRLFNQFRSRLIECGVRMILVDTEANNRPALRFFKKVGFEKPKQHVYLSLNLDSERQERDQNNKGK